MSRSFEQESRLTVEKMTTEEIKELIQLVIETGIAELEVERGDGRVRIKGPLSKRKEVMVPVPVSLGTPLATPELSPALSPSGNEGARPSTATPNDQDETIKSPIVGTYYDSPEPGKPPYVKVGDRVQPKQVLCIIESMKLMNEIEADVGGVVVATHIENGHPVEYGEALFTIRKT